jgi:hypothetical protein
VGRRRTRHHRAERAFSLVARAVFRTRVRDIDCPFKLMRGETLASLPLASGGALLNAELLYQARQHGLRVKEVPITHHRTDVEGGRDLRGVPRATRELVAMRLRFNRSAPTRLRLHTAAATLFGLAVGLMATLRAGSSTVASQAVQQQLDTAKRISMGPAALADAWPPLPNLLTAPLTASDSLWHSGAAGAVIGVVALTLLAAASFRLAHQLTGAVGASWLAPVVVVTDPVVAQLAATGLPDLPLLVLTTASIGQIIKWMHRDDVRPLVLAGLLGCLATLTGYAGWVLVTAETLLIVGLACVRHRDRRAVEGLVILFGLVAFAGIVAWALVDQGPRRGLPTLAGALPDLAVLGPAVLGLAVLGLVAAGWQRAAAPLAAVGLAAALALAGSGPQSLLAAGLLVAAVAAWWPRVLAPALAAVVLAQHALLGGPSAPAPARPEVLAVEAWLAKHYDSGRILADDHGELGVVATGIPIQQFIGSTNPVTWASGMDNPASVATWVVLRKRADDAVWAGLRPSGMAVLAAGFSPVFGDGDLVVYRRGAAAATLVTQSGPHLQLAGARWNPVGVNSYDLLAQSPAVIDQRLAALGDGGHNTVRIWCFDKDGGMSNDSANALALAAADARLRGMRIICTLANTLHDWGGPAAFTPAGGEFFTSPVAQSRYREQVATLLRHRDAAGVALADSPGILAWDLINEPRVTPGAPPASVADWTREMAAFVAALDPHHLVTIGSEGFEPSYPADPTLGGGPGSDFGTLCAIPGISLCSGHLFTKYLADPSDTSALVRVVSAWRATASALDKPVLVEEVGLPVTGPASVPQRRAFYAAVKAVLAYQDVDGGLLWNYGGTPDDPWHLQYGDPASDAALGAWGER